KQAFFCDRTFISMRKRPGVAGRRSLYLSMTMSSVCRAGGAARERDLRVLPGEAFRHALLTSGAASDSQRATSHIARARSATTASEYPQPQASRSTTRSTEDEPPAA